MKKEKLRRVDFLFSFAMMLLAFCASLLVKLVFNTPSLIPMIFVMGVFQISLKTGGYFWGVVSSMASVLAVNYAFTFPYYAIDLITPESLFSAVVMLLVSIATSALTTQIKVQEKIKAEIEMERMRANLLRAVSHDLRTPLTSIYGASSAVVENYDTLSQEQKLKLLGEVRDDAQWLIRMVENLLSVTRIDGGKTRINKQPVVLEELIDTVVVKFRKHYPGYDVRVDMPDDFITVPMDVMLIQQVMVNLLENAVVHAVGMTELQLNVKKSQNKIFFRVCDNGCGIPEERMKNLFFGYQNREDLPTDSSRHNMGIGLSVCAAIIRAHGGEIHAMNNPEGGATFSFWLELEEEYEQQQIQDSCD